MITSVAFAWPGDLQTRTGGYGYDRRLIAGLEDLGIEVEGVPLGPGFPDPAPEDLARAEARLSQLSDGTVVLIDGLAFGVLDAWAQREANRLRIVALVHHPLALETGLDPARVAALRQSETAALSAACAVIVTSPGTARGLVEGYGVPQARITVAVPGTDPGEPRLPAPGDPLLLTIGTLTPRKGHDVLLKALKRIEDLAWRSVIVGSRTLHPQTTDALEAQIGWLGLQGRVELVGEMEDPAQLLRQAHLFVLASRYEGYGMVFAEALAHGLPVVACQAGAVPDVVPPEAGMLVPVDDDAELGRALRRLLEDTAAHRRLSTGARVAGALLPRWDETARLVADCLHQVAIGSDTAHDGALSVDPDARERA